MFFLLRCTAVRVRNAVRAGREGLTVVRGRGYILREKGREE